MSLVLQPSRNSTGFLSDPKSGLENLLRAFGSSAAISDQQADAPVEVSSQKAQTLIRSIPRQASFEERIFDSLVTLKVAVSRYAMHLPAEERARLFARLDQIINVEDWHEEDTPPLVSSFVNFLKWIIFSKNFGWSSIGVSDEGNILVAWTSQNLALTANFFSENKVTWTATVESENGVAHSVGTGSLQHFTKQALFYLSGGAAA
jgi:hypothetical protein